MKKLTLISIKLGDDGLAAIASCVRNIDKLVIKNMNDSEITMKGIHVLTEEILKRDKPVSDSNNRSLFWIDLFFKLFTSCS